jgi:hypothetical protein
MSAMLQRAARRIDPAPRARRRWPFLTAGLVMAAGAAAAAAAVINRRGTGSLTPVGKPSEDATTTTGTPAESAATDVNGRVRTS